MVKAGNALACVLSYTAAYGFFGGVLLLIFSYFRIEGFWDMVLAIPLGLLGPMLWFDRKRFCGFLLDALREKFALHTFREFKTPRSEREVRKRLERYPQLPELDFHWAFALPTAILPESLFLSAKWGFVVVPLVPALALVVFLQTRKRFGMHATLSVLVYIASAMATPFSVLAILNPNVLATFFPQQISALTSQDITLVLVFSNQVALMSGLSLFMGNLWRNRLLQKNGISKAHFRAMNQRVAPVIVANPSLKRLEGPLADIDDVVELFQRAEFTAVVGWGWSTIDRILKILGSLKGMASALGVRSQFDSVYGTRNRTVHEGYVPKLADAYELLVLLRAVLTALSKTNRSWLEQQRNRARDDNARENTKLNGA